MNAFFIDAQIISEQRVSPNDATNFEL